MSYSEHKVKPYLSLIPYTDFVAMFYLLYRKRRCSPSQSKPQGRKRRQPKCKARDQGTDNEFGDGKNEYEESESEAENMPVSSTDLPQLIPTSRCVQTDVLVYRLDKQCPLLRKLLRQRQFAILLLA